MNQFNYNLTAQDIQDQSEALVEFHSQFSHYFRTQTRDVSPHALEYLKGQLHKDERSSAVSFHLLPLG